MLTDQFLVIAVDHPSLSGTLGAFLDELRAERGCQGRGPTRGRAPDPELIDRLAEPKTMRLGVMHEQRLIAAAAVDNHGAVALAVVEDFRGRGIADDLVQLLTDRASKLGYPPLHRFTSVRARLAG